MLHVNAQYLLVFVLNGHFFTNSWLFSSGDVICTEQIMSAALAGFPEEQLISVLKGSFAWILFFFKSHISNRNEAGHRSIGSQVEDRFNR